MTLTASQRISAIGYRNMQVVRDFKEQNPCTDCGKFYPHYVMDLDHLGDKFKVVSKMRTYSPARIKEEMDKCELVCSNCHRIRTHARLV